MVNITLTGRKSHLGAGLACLVVAATVTGFAFAGDEGDRKQPTEQLAPVKLPDIIAVRVHADWCRTCQKLDPVFAKLKSRSKDKPVLFVTFDRSNKATSQQAEYLAGVLGLDTVWLKHGDKVGTIVLIDAKRKSFVASLSAKSTLETLEAAIHSALSS